MTVADVVALRPGPDGAARWGGAASGAGTLAEAARACVARSVVLLAPGEAVLLACPSLPGRGQPPAAAVGYAIEERLAADLETVHVAHGRRRADGGVPVAAVARASIDRWLADCEAAGVRVTAIVPEALALPAPGDGWHVLLDERRAIVRIGAAEGFAIEQASLGAVVAAEPPARVVIEHAPDADIATVAAAFGDCAIEWRVLQGAVLDRLAAGVAAAPLDLRQGPYALRRAGGGGGRLLAAAAAIALAAVGVDAGLAWSRLRALEEARAGVAAASEAAFREAFPQVRRVVDLRAQTLQALAARRAAADDAPGFLPLLRAAGQVLVAHPQLSVASLAYDGTALEIGLTGGDLAAIETVRRAFGDGRLEASVLSADATAQGVVSRLRVTGAAR